MYNLEKQIQYFYKNADEYKEKLLKALEFFTADFAPKLDFHSDLPARVRVEQGITNTFFVERGDFKKDLRFLTQAYPNLNTADIDLSQTSDSVRVTFDLTGDEERYIEFNVVGAAETVEGITEDAFTVAVTDRGKEVIRKPMLYHDLMDIVTRHDWFIESLEPATLVDGSMILIFNIKTKTERLSYTVLSFEK